MDQYYALVLVVFILILDQNKIVIKSCQDESFLLDNLNYGENSSWSTLNKIYNISFLKTCTHQSLPSDEELLKKAISFLQQEDDFNELVIITNKTFDTSQQYHQDENKQITIYQYEELNDNVLNGIMYDILEELKSRTILMIAGDAEWKMVQDFVKTINLKQERLFWIRVIPTTTSSGSKYSVHCSIQLPADCSTDTLGNLVVTSKECLKNKRKTIRAVSSFHDHYVYDVPQARMHILGELHCLGESYLCQKPLDSSGKSWEHTCCSGYYIDLARALFEHTGHSWVIYGTPDGAYGGFNNCSNPEDLTTCQWNGMVNELREGRADIAIAALTMTEARSNVVEFTQNFCVTKLAIALRSDPEHLHFVNWKFTESLDLMLVFSIPAIMIATVICLYSLGKFSAFIIPPSKKYPIKEAFSYGAGLTFQRDLAGKTPDDWSARIVAISYAVALTIIMSTYMANLTATNILKESRHEFKGMYDEKITNPTKDFTYGVINSSATAVLLKSSSTWKKAYLDFVRVYVTKSIKEGMAQVYNGQLDAFIAEYSGLSTMQSTSSQYCDKIYLKKEAFTLPGAFATQKDSYLNPIFSKAIRNLKDNGVFEQLFKKWTKICNQDPKPKAFQFEFEYAGGMVILVGMVFLIALVAFILETIYVHWRTKNPRETTAITSDHFDNDEFQMDDDIVRLEDMPVSYKVKVLTRSDV